MSLDAGFCNTGVVITQFRPADGQWFLATTPVCISTQKESERRHIYATDDKVRRVKDIYGPLRALVRQWEPSLLVAELPLSGGKSAAAHASMAMAITICACLSVEFDLPLRNYNWDDIKLAATGARSAGKLDVQQAIARRFPEAAAQFINPRKKSGYRDEFEHVADAYGAWLAAANGSDVVAALIKQYKEVAYV
jgi:Holliday junction resolvasome RuvABC endonuclease subunit